jgi:bifunctional non-homologous end joining protein LigD
LDEDFLATHGWTGLQRRSLKVRGWKRSCQTSYIQTSYIQTSSSQTALLTQFSPDPEVRVRTTLYFACRGTWGTIAAGDHVTDSVVEIQGKHLKLTNLEKVLYPATGFTKQQVIDYYARIAPAIIPHLAGRALTRKRYPDGVDGEPFFEKNAPKYRPDWVKTAPIWSEGNHRTVHYVLANDLPTLVWLANLAALELHPSLALAKDITCPTEMVFDLDPGPPANIVHCCQVGLWLRDIFEHFGLQSFPKTSGSKGLQLYVPLNTPTNYDATKTFARALAQLLEQDHPEMVVSDMKKSLRTGKVFVDWSQNDEHKTTVAVYSLRAREHPTVSTPITWDDVDRTFKKKDASLLLFEAPQVISRFEKIGDLFAPVITLKQRLPNLRSLTEAVAHEPERIEIAAQADEDDVPPRKTARKKRSAPKKPVRKKSGKI